MKFFKVIIMSLFLASLVACKTTGTNETSGTETDKTVTQNAETKQSKIIDGSNASSDSKFSRIEIGMGTQQVTDLIGSPTQRRSYSTGKAWIPWYFGSDTHRQEYIYKGEGKLTFGGNGRLVAITVDPTEDGYY